MTLTYSNKLLFFFLGEFLQKAVSSSRCMFCIMYDTLRFKSHG